MKYILLLLFLLACTTQLMAQRNYELFDYYYVLHSGDTVREGIVSIDMRYRRRIQLAFVTYKDGSKKQLGMSDIKAFSFNTDRSSLFGKQLPDMYHQVELIQFSEKSARLSSSFYEKIAVCNGYILYRDFDFDEEYWRYLLAKDLVIVDVVPDHKREVARKRLMELMPDCMQTIDMQLWPHWAIKHYRKEAPVHPQK